MNVIESLSTEKIDHVAARVSLSAIVGLGFGTVLSTWKGFPLRSTSFRVASSFAMVGTALFGLERIGYTALEKKIEGEQRLLLMSHSFAGVSGGALNGYLYHRKPIQGIFYFVPVMLGVAFLESTWKQKRQERIEQIFAKTLEDNDVGESK
jgi:hypothetical protein